MNTDYTREGILQKLREVLETWPLYRKFIYPCEEENNPLDLPEIIRLYCHRCANDQNWTIIRTQSEQTRRANFASNILAPGAKAHPPTDRGIWVANYRCKNCIESPQVYRFFYRWSVTSKQEWFFQKVGQYPPIEERIDPQLEDQLSGEDLEFFKKAVRMRNFNLGIASMAYLRRVVENRMNDLLGLIVEALKTLDLARDSGKEMLEEIKKLKTSKNFTDKVEYAEKILPKHLIVGGHNPVQLLHEVTSEALHSKSDDECVEVFDRVRAAFEFLFKKLRVDIDEAKAAAVTFGTLARIKRGQQKARKE